MNMIFESEIEKWRSRVQGCSEVVNADLVSRVPSWVVGAVKGAGGGLEEEKPLMVQSVMCSSLSALESIRSP